MAAFAPCLILLLACCSLSSGRIELHNNGYVGIVVALHSNVPEDKQLVENIKTLFTRASYFLYASTKNQLFFREVTIVIPSTWPTSPDYEVLPGSFFGNAPIRVDVANPEYGDAPYTLQPGGCGESGQYIHITPWFLKEIDGKTNEMFGAPERQFIHEWAHLRYGVFDEYGIPGDKRFPMFYFEDGKIRPTSCVRDIKGWIESRDGGPCTMGTDGQVDPDCIFIPNMDSNEAKASIMYMPFIPSMEGFCDDSEYKHNTRAPTKHNSVCNYRSTWDVINQHDDFDKSRFKRDAASDLTQTLFRLIQSPPNPSARYVLVLDTSGSMNGQPMKLLHRAATRLVEDRIPEGSYLGIVQFSTEASILRNLTKVDNITRIQLSRSLPQKDDGGRTAIGKGLQEALNVLKGNNDNTDSGLIMLITDGEENVTPFIEDVLPEILTNKVIVNAVAFGSDASDKLEHITTLTGGRGYFFSNMNGSRPASALDSAFMESVTSQADVELQPVQLKDEMFGLDRPEIQKFIYLDQELGKNTIFTVTSPHVERVEINLLSPSGSSYGPSSPHYTRDNIVRERVQIVIEDAEPGTWTMSFNRIGDYEIIVGFNVASEPKDIRNQPIRVRSWLQDVQLKFPAYAKVYAEVKKGYNAIVGANVLATVERPIGASVDVELRDDGIGADVTENDGVYTSYFTHFNGNGRYAVMARVHNDGQARLSYGTRASASQAMPHLKSNLQLEPQAEFPIKSFAVVHKNSSHHDTGAAAGKFDRSSNSGAFRLESWTPDAKDFIPPDVIGDLTVLSTNCEENDSCNVLLQWTTPGDDLDQGQASILELKMSKSMEKLLADFESGLDATEHLLQPDSLIPQLAGTKQNVSLTVPESLYRINEQPFTIYFAMKAKDKAGNAPKMYNIAAGHFGIEITEAHTLGQVLDDEFKSPNSGDESGHWWLLTVIVIGVLSIIMIFVILAVIILKKTRMKTYASVQGNQI